MNRFWLSVLGVVAVVAVVTIFLLPRQIAIALGFESTLHHSGKEWTLILIGIIALFLVVGGMLWAHIGPDLEPSKTKKHD